MPFRQLICSTLPVLEKLKIITTIDVDEKKSLCAYFLVCVMLKLLAATKTVYIKTIACS